MKASATSLETLVNNNRVVTLFMDVFEKLCLLPAFFLVTEGTIIVVVVIGSSQKGRN
jgi:hypothetical protein